MKLLIAADIFPPQSGGPATYCVTLAKGLLEYAEEVKIVSLNPFSDISASTAPVSHVHFKNKFLRYIEYFFLLLKHARSSDVVYAMGPVNSGLPALFAARICNKKFAVKVVGDYAWEQGVTRFGVAEMIDVFQNKNYSGVVGLLKRLERYVVRRAQLVVVPSVYLKNIVALWGASLSKVIVIYNAVDFSRSERSEFERLSRQKPVKEQWIVSVGRLVSWKGTELLIEIMSELTRKYPDTRLKIIGDGPERGRLRDKVDALGLTSYVELLGNVSRETALAYMEASDVVVLNSGYEGLSHVLIEALNVNARVLASDAGGNPEVILDRETGLLFAYNDKEKLTALLIAALAGQMPRPFTKTIGRAAFFERFAFDTMINETREQLTALWQH